MQQTVFSMADGGRTKFHHINTPLSIKAGLPSQTAHGGWQKICHTIPPLWLLGRYLTTPVKHWIE